MSVIDKFLNAMKMNDDGLDEEDYYDEEEDFEEEKASPRGRFLTKIPVDDDDDEDEDDEPSYSRSSARSSESAQRSRSFAKPAPRTSKISPMRQRKSGGGMAVTVIRPRSMDDASEITDALLDQCTVILNMEGVEFELAQRIIDFTSGSCYAIRGGIQKISNYIFLVTPESVELSGDFQDMLAGAFDVPALNKGY